MKEQVQTNVDSNTKCPLDNQLKCGVYCILNTTNNKFYIGSVTPGNSRKNFRRRWQNHIRQLMNNKHCNKHLQGAFNIDGKQSFQFIILEIFDNISKTLEREQYWIDNSSCLNPEIGYNKYPKALCLNLEYKMRKDSIQKLKASLIGKPRPMWMKLKYGKPIIQYSLDMIYINEFYSMTEAQRQTGIHRTGIKECVNFRYKQAGGFIWRYKNLNN